MLNNHLVRVGLSAFWGVMAALGGLFARFGNDWKFGAVLLVVSTGMAFHEIWELHKLAVKGGNDE